MGQKTLIAIVFALLVSVTMIISCAGPSPVVTFPDYNLEKVIRHAVEDLEAPIQEFVEKILEKTGGLEGITRQEGVFRS